MGKEEEENKKSYKYVVCGFWAEAQLFRQNGLYGQSPDDKLRRALFDKGTMWHLAKAHLGMMQKIIARYTEPGQWKGANSMSVKARAWALVQQIDPTDKLVLLAMADRADDDGICWPGIEGVAEICEVTDHYIISAINRLVVRGLVTVEGRHMADWSQTSEKYTLLIDKGK